MSIVFKNTTKQFGEFTACNDISFEIEKGEIHALLGENGAGKSTLMNLLYGIHQPTSGHILIDQKPVNFKSPLDAIKQGIGMVHQHFMLIQPFTALENIILGDETTRLFGMLDIGHAKQKILDLSIKYGMHVDPMMKIEEMTVGMQQRVELLKLLYRKAQIIILDEPTAVLTPQEIKDFEDIVRHLKKEGKTIIIITHKLKEIKEIADRCTIIRKGQFIETVQVNEVSELDLAEKMVGRSVNLSVKKENINRGDLILKIENLVVHNSRRLPAIKGLNLDLYRGEILGLAGIDGNGQSELVESITGLKRTQGGHIFLNGNEIANLPAKEIIDRKVGMIPEDRQKRGLVMDYSVRYNLVLKQIAQRKFSSWGQIIEKQITQFAQDLIQRFDIRPNDQHRLAKELSGGNQQKVIIARELTLDPDLLIAVQPTRGLDVGAIEFVHHSIVEQRNHNKAVLLVSFELEEILSLSDRIAVIYEGKIIKILSKDEANRETVGLYMAGGKAEELAKEFK